MATKSFGFVSSPSSQFAQNLTLCVSSQYGNVADRFLGDLPDGTTFGRGPFREVRLLVDGMVAGVALPYPVFFTGADVPPAWR